MGAACRHGMEQYGVGVCQMAEDESCFLDGVPDGWELYEPITGEFYVINTGCCEGGCCGSN
jgi:hypothetical protein